MKYMLQIYTHDVTDAFESLSEDEQKAIFGEYMAINETPGVRGGAQLQPTRDGDDGAGRRTAGR